MSTVYELAGAMPPLLPLVIIKNGKQATPEPGHPGSSANAAGNHGEHQANSKKKVTFSEPEKPFRDNHLAGAKGNMPNVATTFEEMGLPIVPNKNVAKATRGKGLLNSISRMIGSGVRAKKDEAGKRSVDAAKAGGIAHDGTEEDRHARWQKMKKKDQQEEAARSFSSGKAATRSKA